MAVKFTDIKRIVLFDEIMHLTITLVTDVWSIQLTTNYYLRETRALAAISRTGLAISVNYSKNNFQFDSI